MPKGRSRRGSSPGQRFAQSLTNDPFGDAPSVVLSRGFGGGKLPTGAVRGALVDTGGVFNSDTGQLEFPSTTTRDAQGNTVLDDSGGLRGFLRSLGDIQQGLQDRRDARGDRLAIPPPPPPEPGRTFVLGGPTVPGGSSSAGRHGSSSQGRNLQPGRGAQPGNSQTVTFGANDPEGIVFDSIFNLASENPLIDVFGVLGIDSRNAGDMRAFVQNTIDQATRDVGGDVQAGTSLAISRIRGAVEAFSQSQGTEGGGGGIGLGNIDIEQLINDAISGAIPGSGGSGMVGEQTPPPGPALDPQILNPNTFGF